MLHELAAEIINQEEVIATLTETIDMVNAENDTLMEQNAQLMTENALLVSRINASSPSGQAPPSAGVPKFNSLIYVEDFNEACALGSFPGGRYINTVAVYPPTYYDTSKNVGRPAATQGQYNAMKTISVADGVMKIHLWTDPATLRPYAAAPVPLILGPDKTTWGNQNLTWPDQLYGRYSVRYRVPAPIPGWKQAWLLWPDYGTNTTGEADGTGGNGEIDLPETGFDTLNSIGFFVHHQGATVGNDQYSKTVTTDLTQWHTVTLEWSPNLCIAYLDGVEFGRETDRVPNTMMHWVLQTETKISPTPPAVSVAGDVLIDWIAAWRYTG